ncbi:hypothetical protein [Candidatus Poriferisodalis sp.]|uniref:hypothetical protein n=1 Tax=Candidatus Poriferisodalis sp. TaxID=3101277 RepID=UPI003B5AE47E
MRRWLVLLLTASLLGATLLGAPFTSVAGADGGTGTDTAPEACDTADAISKARAAFDWHDRHGSLTPMFWRILNTLGADNLPAKPANVTDDTITAADVETFSNGKTWTGWQPIGDALKCTEKAAEDTDDGSDTSDGESADPAPEACDTADAVSKARAAFDWHDRHGSLTPMFWRILNTLGADNLPAKPANVTDDTITAADVETFSNGKTWTGWQPIGDALKCTEKAAEDTDEGAGADDGTETDDGPDTGDEDGQDTDQDTQQQQQQSSQDQQSQQDSLQQESQQDQVACSLEWAGNGGSDTVTVREGRDAFSHIIVRGTETTCETNGFSPRHVCARVQVGGNLQGQTPHASHVYLNSLGLWYDSQHTGTAPHVVQHAVGSRWGGECSGSINWTEAASASGHHITVRGSVEDDSVVADHKVQFEIWAANNGGLRSNPVLYMQISDNDTPCTGWDSSDISIGEDDYREVKLSNTPAGCGDFDSTITLDIDVVASHNGTKPYRDGCTSDRYTHGDDVGVLGIVINTKNGWLQASPCDDNTIVERQVIIRDTNPAGGAATKTITITDDDSYHPMSPTWVYVRRQSGSTGQTPPYNAYISVQTGRAYYEPYRLLVLQTGAAHPQPNKNSFIDDGATITINVPADDDGFTPKYKWYDNIRVDCHRNGPGWVQVHVYRENGPKFDTSTIYRDGGDKIQVCW